MFLLLTMEKLNSLQGLPKANPFLVPENYFDTMEKDVMARIKQQQIRARHRRIYTIASAVAAVAALLIVLNIGIFNNKQSTQLASTKAVNEQLLANSEANFIAPITEPEISLGDYNLDNLDYQILDYYNDEQPEMDILY